MGARMLLWFVVVALAGCGGTSSDDDSPIETQVRRVVNEASEKKVDRVDCIKDTKHVKQYRCKIELDSGECQSGVINDVGTEAAFFERATDTDYEGCDF